MKHIKRLLFIILFLTIGTMGYHLYTKLQQGNLELALPAFFEEGNSVMNIVTPIEIKDLENSLSLGSTITNTPVPKSTSNSNIATHFYYNQLDENAKIIYSTLESNISNLVLENYKMNFSTRFNTLLNTPGGNKSLGDSFQSAIDAFSYDHPELFYLDLTKVSLLTKSRTIGTKTTYYVSLVPDSNNNYLCDQFYNTTILNQSILQVEKLKDSFVSQVSGDDYHKIRQVHDTLVNMISYDTTYSRKNTHNIYGALVENSAVCEGYAKSFKYILDTLGIPCILVPGTGINSNGDTESHMWNYVQLNNVWYAVDVTWDDPIIIGGSSSPTIRHDYFCKGSYHFNSSHKLSGRISEKGKFFSYPTLSNIDYQ